MGTYSSKNKCYMISRGDNFKSNLTKCSFQKNNDSWVRPTLDKYVMSEKPMCEFNQCHHLLSSY